MNTRQTILAAVGILVIVAIGVWWYFGFTLDFMRFFAAEPASTCPPGTVVVGYTNSVPPNPICRAPSDSVSPPISCRNLPPGCTCQEVQCFKAPCNPIIVCPSCVPRPSCMNDNPPCAPDLAPGAVLCPVGGIVSCAPPTQTVQVGESATLSAFGGNGAYEWYAPEATSFGSREDNIWTSPQLSVSYGAPGIKYVTVQSSRGDSSQNIDSVACKVVVEPVGI